MKAASLFSGCGGMDLGFERAGFDVVWANEMEPDAVDTYRKLIGPNIVLGDIKDVGVPVDDYDLVFGGPPCQGFSVMGKLDPTDPRSRMVWVFYELVCKLKPRAFVMENVKALGSGKRWEPIRIALKWGFEQLGYEVHVLVLNANDFGVPQRRERMFMVGVPRGSNYHPPRPNNTGTTVLSALARMPAYGEPGNRTQCNAKIVLARQPVLRASPYAGMLFNGAGRPIDINGPAPTLPASMGGNATPIIDQRWLEGSTKKPWVEKYHAWLMEGGVPDWTPPDYLRRLTLEEAADLQGFPLLTEFCGKSKWKQIGNAVPLRLAQAVAESVYDVLG